MNGFVLAIVKALILEAAALLVLADSPLRRGLASWRVLTTAYAVVGALSIAAFLNFGELHGGGHLVHWSEQYHFDLGDKYLRELQYDGIYLATVESYTEEGRPAPRDVRDPMTFDMIPADEVPARAEHVRERFSSERWTAFRTDLRSLLREQRGAASTGDHGNTASPAGAIIPWALLGAIPMHGLGFRLLACVDLLLLGGVFLACWRWSSLRVASMTAVLALAAPHVMDFLLGSLFRFDWAVAAIGGTLALGRRRYATAGGLFAYAALARPFSGAFALGALVGLAGEVARRQIPLRTALRFAVAGVATALALALLGTLLFGPSIWPSYYVRMLATAHEGYYGMNVGIRDLYAQVVRDGMGTLLHPIPTVIAAATPRGLSSMPGFPVLQAAFVLAVLVACWRDGAVMGAGLGAFVVFGSVVTNAYYQTTWGVLGIALALHARTSFRARAGYALACGVFGLRYVMSHFGEWSYAEFYFASWSTLAFGLVWLVASSLSAPMTPVVARAS